MLIVFSSEGDRRSSESRVDFMYYPNDDKEDDNKKDADIEDDDVHQLITKKKNVKVSTCSIAACVQGTDLNLPFFRQ